MTSRYSNETKYRYACSSLKCLKLKSTCNQKNIITEYNSFKMYKICFSSIVRTTGHRNCAVFGCTNSWRQLDSWMRQPCQQHGCLKGSGSCICAPPFILYPFPSSRYPERRQAWIRNIKRESGTYV